MDDSTSKAAIPAAPQGAAQVVPRRTAPLLARVVIGLAGIGLLVGFFLPWIRLANMVELSGLALIASGGEVVEELSGPYRTTLLVVPLSGLLLFAVAVRGTRGLAWLGLACGALVLGVGLYTVIQVFLDAVGPGIWMITASTLVVMVVGLLALRSATR